jgi:dolichyl-diphosphooligosaccharide--protein glycosyltransferase
MSDKDEITTEDEGPNETKTKGRFRRRRKNAEFLDEAEPIRRRDKRRKGRERRLSKKEYESEEEGVSQGRLWLSQNWKTMLALFLIFLFGLFLRSYFYYPPATENGFILSGNDPYYHKRVVDYVQENHEHLIFDPLLSYPDGAINPRPPMFDWSVVILGMLLAPFFGGDSVTSTWQVMEFSPAFWGALTAIPVYLIGKEMFNRKAGLLCALLLAIMPSHVERSPLGFSDHDAIVLFFVTLSFFFFIKALNSLKIRDKWVENWFSVRDIPKGIRKWFKYNQVSVAFSLLAGLSLASVALIWKGFLYPVVIIIVYFFIQMIINKLRNKDSLGVSLCTIITLAVVAILPIPYYTGNRMGYIIDPAMEILVAVIIVSAVLVPTRDSPWLLVFSALAAVLVCGFILLIYIFPEIGSTYFSGQGYFSENKIFSTIAEAQAPDYSRAVFSYGVVTTFLALYAILISIIRVAKDLKAHYLFLTIWGITAVYMAISATRFIFNAGPIFAILAGWMTYEIIKRLDFRKMMKHYRSLKGGGRFYAMKKSVKVSHIVGVLFLVFMIFLPNIWLGWDAGVPFGEKKDVDVAVYDALPFFMKPDEYNADEAGNRTRYPDGTQTMYNRTNLNELKYFGAFGHGFPSDYWLDGMRWLSEQDQDLPVEERPAFISWWDYGFWAIYLGEHPTAADNFQGRVQYAGSFISAQGEDQAISLLIARILEADKGDYRYKDGHDEFKLHEGVRNILVQYFGEEKAAEIEDVVLKPWDYRNEVLDNPSRYGHYTSDMAVDFTPIYAILQTWIPELLTEDEMVWLYNDLQEETGYSLRYFAIDSRLFPFGPQNTGIFYAPLKLSDHRINDNNEPFDYLETWIIASDNREYTLDEFKAAQEENPELEAKDFKLKYYEPVLNSMLLKCYIGYTLDDIEAEDPGEGGTEPNIPAVQATNYPPMQGRMMKHFQLVYRTSYWNPNNSTEYKYHPDAWEAMLDKDAEDLRTELENDGIDNDGNGKIDDSGEGGVVSSGLRSGVVFLKYYAGAYLNGTVTTTKGTPLSNVRVTVLDEWDIPHDTVHTDENGSYHLIAPAGNVTIKVTSGGFEEGEFRSYAILSQREQTELEELNINVSDDQVMRRKIDEDNDGIWDYNIVKDIKIEPNILKGKVYWDMDSNDEYDLGSDLNISQATVHAINEDLDMEYSVITPENGTYIFDDLSPGNFNISLEINGHIITLEEKKALKTGDKETKDVGIKPSSISGIVNSYLGEQFEGEEIHLIDKLNDDSIKTYLDSEGGYSYDLLLPGNYTINVDIDGFERFSEEIGFGQGNVTWKNITLSPSTDLLGLVYITESGSPVANSTLRFDGLYENLGIVKFTTTNNTGFYDIDLKNGKYEIWVKHDIGEETPFVYLNDIDVQGGIISFDIPLERSIKVHGQVFRDANFNGTIDLFEERAYAEIIFESSQGGITVTTNSSGFYRVYLPEGDYIVRSTFPLTSGTSIEELSLSGSESVELNIDLENGDTLSGNVYYDANENNEMEFKEALRFATLTFTDVNGTQIMITSDFVGFFNLFLQRTVNYSVLVEHPGFQDLFLDFMNLTDIKTQSEFNLIPLDITTYGITQFEGAPIENVSISFTEVGATGSEDNTTSSDSAGDYSLGILPGEYRVLIDHNTTENGKDVRYLYDGPLDVEVGEESREFDINLTKQVKIEGTVNGTTENVSIFFESPDEETVEVTTVNSSFEVYLIPKEYNVRINHMVNLSTYYVYSDTTNLNESQSIQLNVTMGVKVEGQVLYDNDDIEGIEIIFTGNGSLPTNSNSSGGYSIFLPPNGTYEVTINQTQDEGSEEVRFTFLGTLDVSTNDISNWNITLTKFVKVKGDAYIDYNGNGFGDETELMDNISIQFDSDTDDHRILTNETGSYEVFLLLDELYDITLSAEFATVEEELNITPSMTNTHLDLSINPANLTISGRTQEDGAFQSYTALWFWKLSDTAINSSTISDIDGNYSQDISYGDYTVYARKVSGSEVLVHLGEISVRPRENLVFDLNLTSGTKVNGMVYYINSTGMNKSAQTVIEFDEFGTVDTKTNEDGVFEIWLPPGTYLTSADISTSEFNMTMNYELENYYDITDDVTLYMNLSKSMIYDVELEWIEDEPATLARNESTTYNVSIKNTGNTEETFDILANFDASWNVTNPFNFTLGIGESRIFEVQIGATMDATVEHENVTIIAEARSKPEDKDELELKADIVPEYQAANLTLQDAPRTAGNNTLDYTLNVLNVGNGRDTFNLSLSDVPDGWNVTLSETSVILAASDPAKVFLTVKIPFNTTVKSATIILNSISKTNLTSTLEIEVEVVNLDIEEEDLRITGDEVSEGPVDRSTIPGFESIALISTLIGVAILMRRRRSK